MGPFERYLFPWGMDKAMAREKMSRIRRNLLEDSRGEILEIGFGTGLNLAHYPDSIRKITRVDVNPGMNRRALRRMAESSIEVDHQVTSAEGLPMPDASFDTVVSTWTLCSIGDLDGALREVRRVLRPSGQLLFVEHGLAADASVRRWQNRLNGLQKIIGAGCNLNRNFRELIPPQGFAFGSLKEYYLPDEPRTHAYTYQGVARRA